MTLSPVRALGTTSAWPGIRHSISAGIFRARISVSTATAVAWDPFQHPRLACETSRRGAIDSAEEEGEEADRGGARERRRRTAVAAAEAARSANQLPEQAEE